MSFRKQRRSLASLLLIFVVLASSSLSFAGKKKDSSPTEQVIDSGSFGIFVKGKRVATEKFEITQTPTMSVAKAELKLDQDNSSQKTELQLSTNGNLIRYEWNENGKGQAIVEPKDEFLVEHVTLTQPQKTAEQPFILPPSTLVLDDGFFSQREILLWRYLATQCQPKKGEQGCTLPEQQYGVIVPRQQTSMQIGVAYKGTQKVNVKGTDLSLQRFELHTDSYDWTVWIDASYKIQKIAVDGEDTEIYRD
jgi:hypothetical protein